METTWKLWSIVLHFIDKVIKSSNEKMMQNQSVTNEIILAALVKSVNSSHVKLCFTLWSEIWERWQGAEEMDKSY